jgi:hypothetical protein
MRAIRSATSTFRELGCKGAWHQEPLIDEIATRLEELSLGHGVWSRGQRLREELGTIKPLSAFWDLGARTKEILVM